MSLKEQAQKLSENVWTSLITKAAVLLTGPALTLILTLYGGNIEKQRQLDLAQLQRVEQFGVDTRARLVETNTTVKPYGERLALIESNAVRGRADREEFQRDTRETLEKISDTNIKILERMAALEAVAVRKQAGIKQGKRPIRLAKRDEF
jgi:hypothetical protein